MYNYNPYAKQELLVTSLNQNDQRESFDISTLVSGITYTTCFKGQPSKLTFTCQQDPNNILNLHNGSIVQFKRDDVGIFYGYIFNMGTDATDTYRVVCYDQMRYLKNEITTYLAGKTVSDNFIKLCQENQLNNYKVVTPTSFVAPSKVYSKKSIFNILEEQMTRADINDKKQYFIRDNFGVLEFTELSNCMTDLVIGEGSLLTSYQFDISIDKDTYNQVKVMKKNTKTNKWDSYIEKDSGTQKRWGLLQMIREADENQNEAQLKKLAQDLIKLHNRETRTLKLSALGVDGINAGSGINVYIPKLRVGTEEKYLKMWVVGATHRYDKDHHTMELEVAIP